MKPIFKLNCLGAILTLAIALSVSISCNKQERPDVNDFFLKERAAWQMKSSGETVADRSIIDLIAPDQTNCYGTVIDENDYLGDPLQELIITHDGGATWHSETISELKNNYFFGEAATTGNVIHVFGYNYVTGGGNVFRSTDGGTTWQREAANAYTDLAASFPDVIKFFDREHGVIFGDPENGYFEIYTTSDGGNTWTRVPANQLPTPKAGEKKASLISPILISARFG